MVLTKPGPVGTTPVFYTPYTGPFIIKAQIAPGNYEVIRDDGSIWKVHQDRLKPAALHEHQVPIGFHAVDDASDNGDDVSQGEEASSAECLQLDVTFDFREVFTRLNSYRNILDHNFVLDD